MITKPDLTAAELMLQAQLSDLTDDQWRAITAVLAHPDPLPIVEQTWDGDYAALAERLNG